MAARLPSASASRSRSSSGLKSSTFTMEFLTFERQPETEQQPALVAHVADDEALRFRAAFDERGNSHDLVLAAAVRLLIDVDDLELVTAREMLLAYRAHRADGTRGSRREPGH